MRDIPAELAGPGYDVYVYALGGAPNTHEPDLRKRGGAYRILDGATQKVLQGLPPGAMSNESPRLHSGCFSADDLTYAAGDYMVFSGINAGAITIEATTENGLGMGVPRAPINAIQLVAAQSQPLVAIARSTQSISLTFTVPFAVRDDGCRPLGVMSQDRAL